MRSLREIAETAWGKSVSKPTATLVPGRAGTVELEAARPPAVSSALTLGPAIARVGQWLKHYDRADPRLPALREWYSDLASGGRAPRMDMTDDWLRDWESFLGLGPKPLRQRPAGQLCDRCDFDGAPIISQVVKNYGHRATCPQCGEAWVARA